MTMITTKAFDKSPTASISETGKEDQIQCFQKVTSKAIAQAAQHASRLEYADAIETLVVAINLIKRSRVQKEESVVALLTLLEDTLSGVETRSYGDGRAQASG